MAKENVFVWWPDKEGNAPDPKTGACKSEMSRYTFEPRSDDLSLPTPVVLASDDCEFPRIDNRVASKQHDTIFYMAMDPTLGTDFAAIGHLLAGFPPYNAIARLDLGTGRVVKYFPGRTHVTQEPVFVPRGRDAKEGDGYIVALVNNLGTLRSQLHIIDTGDFSKAQAVIHLPMNLRMGLHGNWVDSQDVGFSNE